MRLGVPSASLLLYARWWQLESWLRELVYVELRAAHGCEWESVVQQGAGRQTVDAAYTHMQSTDTLNPLAYLDYSQIIELIAADWDRFAYALLTQKAWDGRQEELKRIRHRIGHMRRPHQDDIARIEQTLRDLEHGAFIALASYNDTHVPDPDSHDDAVTRGWIRGEHEDALRLIEHARRQYETRLYVRSSGRPWVARGQRMGHGAGHLWHADFYLRGRAVDLPRLWYDSYLDRVRDLIVHVTCDDSAHVRFTFSGADDDRAVADAIGSAFDAVLTNAYAGPLGPSATEREAWRRSVSDVDFRVLPASRWSIVDPSTVPIAIFGVGGGVRTSPRW